MIRSTAVPALASDRAWRELEGALRPFVAKRIRAESDVDDVLQDVFMKIQRGLPSLRNDQRFGPWVYRIARSAVVDHLRASARQPRAAGVADEAPPELDEADDRDVEREVARYVGLFVSMLPSPYREALTL